MVAQAELPFATEARNKAQEATRVAAATSACV